MRALPCCCLPCCLPCCCRVPPASRASCCPGAHTVPKRTTPPWHLHSIAPCYLSWPSSARHPILQRCQLPALRVRWRRCPRLHAPSPARRRLAVQSCCGWTTWACSSGFTLMALTSTLATSITLTLTRPAADELRGAAVGGPPGHVRARGGVGAGAGGQHRARALLPAGAG